jgi:type III pantothenate kinase
MSDPNDVKLLLVVDIGNTNTVFGIFSGDRLVADFRVETRRNRTGDEFYAMLEPLLRRWGYVISSVGDVVLSTVVPPSIHPMTKFAEAVTGRPPVIVDHRMNVGLKLLYHRPEEMGADRVVNAVYSYRKYGASIVVDFGTATTFDVVNGQGEYLGGCITPGIRISMDALFTYAARLPRIEVRRPENTIGRSTEEAMRSGVYYGYVAMVDGLVKRLLDAAQMEAKVVATGGLAKLIAKDATSIDVVEPNLTLCSLAMLYNEHQGER